MNGRLVVQEKTGLVERRLEGRLVERLGLVWDIGLDLGLDILDILGLVMVWTDLNLRMVMVVVLVWVLIDLIDLVRVLVRTGLGRIPTLVRG